MVSEKDGWMKSSLPVLLMAAAMSAALACAAASAPEIAAQASEASSQPAPEAERAGPRTFRIGVWELDLLALDLEPSGTTFRMLDFKILKVLEIGRGADYHSFSLVEIPDLLHVISTRREGSTSEHRFVDLKALELAALRVVRTHSSAEESETHLLKIPLLGSLYGHEIDGESERHKVLYLGRWETERR
jgi:hypothetical protein